MTLAFFCSPRAWALDSNKSLYQFNCRNWTRQNGLPTDRVSTITQDADGYLWLGTQDGLICFNGLEFKTVPIDLPSAQGHVVSKLIATKDRSIHFAIQHGAFGSYRDHLFSAFGDGRWSVPEMGANMILETRDGFIWTGADSGFGRWSAADPGKSFFATVTNLGPVLSACEDGTGRIWVGIAEKGLYYWQSNSLVPLSNAASISNSIIFALAADAYNQLWIGTSLGLYRYAKGRVEKVNGMDNQVNALLVDRKGILWVGTVGSGVARGKNGNFEYLSKGDGLGSDTVNSLYEDAEGSLWIGTRDGLSQLSDLKLPIVSSKEGICNGSSHQVCASQKGGLWIGTDNGLSYFDGQNAINYTNTVLGHNAYVKSCFEARNGDVYFEDADKNIGIISHQRRTATLSSSTWISAIAEDSKSILVGMGTGDALYRIQNGKYVHYTYPDSNAPDYYWVNNLCVAKDDTVWVGSKNGIFHLQARSIDHYGTTTGLSGDNALWIFEDSDGTIWAGLATGIARIKDGQVKNIKPENGLADNWIYAIVADDCGNFWFSSSHGIFRASRKSLNDFADGKTGNINCELFNGPEDVKSTDRTDQENSGCKTRDGRIWFPCPWGVVMIDPAHLPVNRVAAPVHIERVLANGKEYPLNCDAVVPPGEGQLKFQFDALSFIASERIQFHYRLDGFDNEWVNSEGRRDAVYASLKPGRYTFHVIAANADGVWNTTGASVRVELRPHFQQTTGFYLLCGALGLWLLASIYAWRVRHLQLRQQALQAARDQLESEVSHRTAELARANASLQREVEEHRQTSTQLAKRTQLLETEIAERERMQLEIERVHQQLVEASRRAGMAEVATNVLHNVGNVLNSVNVSASLVTDNAKKSKLKSLARVVALLNEHSGDLGSFLTADPKGRQVPGFLNQLAEQLAVEQQHAVEELELLRQNIEHIKDIVARQQSYAKSAGLIETVAPSAMIEDALRMNFGTLVRHGVEVAREFAPVPDLSVEKHKVLQILVNLIRNANQACDDSGRNDKRLTLRLASVDGQVQIAVSDNGVGIPAENMTRIFNHGFTTRKGGHGFGLHSCALAATELGGSLTAQSDGPGQGATFTLTLPVKPPTAA